MNFADPLGLCPEGVQADSARRTGKRETTHYCADGSTEVRSGGTWAWRNNNPGNLRRSCLAVGSSGGFAVFGTVAAGNEAHWRLLSGALYRNLTLWELVNKYAPASDGNDPVAYMNAITRATGMGRHVLVSELTESTMSALVHAMQQHEGWSAGTVTITPPEA